jgi:hypothetical protein
VSKFCAAAIVLLFGAWTGAAYGAQDVGARDGAGARDEAAVPTPADAARQRDPFRPFTLDIRPVLRPQTVQATPLLRYELGQLTVVGTVWEISPPRAMLEDSFGMGYIVTLGTPIGRNGGVITAIEPSRVVVEERTLDFYGKEQVNRIVMETPKEEGSTKTAGGRE